MVHYHDNIKNFGSPNGLCSSITLLINYSAHQLLCSSITESKHITAVKHPWRRTNKHMALLQMLIINQRLDKIAAARVDFATRGMLADSCLIQALKDTLSNTTHSPSDSMDEDTSNPETESETSDDGIPIPNPHNDKDTGDEQPLDDDTSQRVPPVLPTDEDDDDCGPVESGPLMNEVHLIGRKGKMLSVRE
jgi:hypothetical protein